jgi:methylated-DNA-[protein]-cysteine S-methyltransferase
VLQKIEQYLEDARSDLELDLELDGTPFQRHVWQALRAIPPGRTLTYGELAQRIGSGARAVGNACRANPCPLVVPCHRVVAAKGLGGFAGERSGRKLEIKRWLLHHEGWL